jgi:Uma2 family endonuclease
MQPVPRVPPLDRPATYDDLVRLPDHVVAEIVDGELHASPRPAFRHARIGSLVGGLLVPAFDQGRGGPGGWWILYEPELHLGKDVLVPDWAGWRRVRTPGLPGDAFSEIPPDWLCEILSPSTAALDRAKKLRIYARHGVGHAWLIDAAAKTLDVLELEGSRWSIVTTYAGNDSVRAVPFTEVEIPLHLFWSDE